MKLNHTTTGRIIWLLACAALLALACEGARGSEFVTLTIYVTNKVVGTIPVQTLVINGDTRTFTNDVSTAPATLIQSTNGYLLDTTNIFRHYALYPVGDGATRLFVAQANSNVVTFLGQDGKAIAFTVGGVWGEGFLSTNVGGGEVVVRVPMGGLVPSQRTNVASDLAAGLSSWSTQSLAVGSIVLSNAVQLAGNQVVAGAKVFASIGGTASKFTNGSLQGTILSNSAAIGGNAHHLTNGQYWTPILRDPVMTNGVNRGDAFSSPGSENFSEQFGIGALATGTLSLAVGTLAVAGGYASAAIGNGAHATGGRSTALGIGALATNESTIAIGNTAHAYGSNSMAIGKGSSATHSNSIAIGNNSATASNDEIVFGNSAHTITIPGVITSTAQTNSLFRGTNAVAGDWSWQMSTLSSVAAGNNTLAPAAQAVYVYLSGTPGASFTLAAITGARPGRVLVIENGTGFGMTIAHESGFDGTVTRRIICPDAVDVTVSGRGTITLVYNGTSSRWVLQSSPALSTPYYAVQTNNTGTHADYPLTNVPAGSFRMGQFGYLAQHETNNVATTATAHYTNVATGLAFTSILTNGFTGSMVTGILTNSYGGYYWLDGAVTVWPEVDNNLDEVELELFLNGLAFEDSASYATLETGIANRLSAKAQVYLPAGTTVEMKVRNLSDASSSLQLWRAILSIR